MSSPVVCVERGSRKEEREIRKEEIGKGKIVRLNKEGISH
jgi:hypothetical protein